jgi:hypothetical protein
MKIREIYEYLKLNGVRELETVGPRPDQFSIYVHNALIANPEQAWLNVDFMVEVFSTKPHDFKFTKKVTSFDLDRFISEYKYYYSDDRIRDLKLAKLQSAIMKHRYREAVKERIEHRIKIGLITVNGTEVR